MSDEKEIKLDPMKEVVTAGNILRIIKEAAAAQGVPIGRTPGNETFNIPPKTVQVGCFEKDGFVVIDYGQQVRWISMAPDQAQKFANTVMATAVEILKPPVPGTAGTPKDVDKPE